MEPEKRAFIVRGLRLEAERILAVELAPVEGDVPSWEPGAHLDLVVGDGTARQYSLCGRPGAPTLRIAVLHETAGRGGSRWVHETLRPGQVVRVGGPRNHFVLEPAARYLFVAGGVGITPILPMLGAASAAGADWELHYFGRSASAMAFLDELEVHGERVHLHPEDRTGSLPDATRLSSRMAAPMGAPMGEGGLMYLCGPAGMLDAMEKAAAEDGWGDRLRLERFAAPAGDGAAAPAGSFDVHLAVSGTDLHVPAERSLLEVLREAGVDMVSDCEEGICGSCETRVVSGEIEHRDHVLTPQERAAGECLMACVSRAAGSRLVLDL